MKKFYIVEEGSKLYQDYKDWIDTYLKNNKRIFDFMREHRIYATEYFSNNYRFGIVPKVFDDEKFGNQFIKHIYPHGLRLFKKNSFIGKNWVKYASTMKFPIYPSPARYNEYYTDRDSSELLYYDGLLYASIDAENISVPDTIFHEIQESEFYKIMEDL